MGKDNKLSSEDMERVEKYLNSGFNRSERKPFRGWILLIIVWVIIGALGSVSWYIGKGSGFL